MLWVDRGRLHPGRRSGTALSILGASAAVAGALACIGAVVAVDARYRSLGQPPYVDWLTYANAFERVIQGEPLYAAKQLAGPYLLPHAVTSGYAYPPPSAVLFAPFASQPGGLIAWLVLNAAIYWSALTALTHRAFGLPVVWAAALTAFTLAPFVPLATGLATGNVNVAMAGLTGWAWLGIRQAWVAPVAGFAALVKLYPAFLAGWAARWQGPQALIRGAAPAIAVSIVALPIVGLSSWLDYVTALRNAEPACWPGTASVACAVAPLMGSGAGKLVGIAIGLVLLLIGMRATSPFVGFVVITLGMLAPVTDGWIHYGLFAYVLMLVGFAHVFGPRLARRGLRRGRWRTLVPSRPRAGGSEGV